MTNALLEAGQPANDYAPVNQGQLKKVATGAVQELDRAGRAGSARPWWIRGRRRMPKPMTTRP